MRKLLRGLRRVAARVRDSLDRLLHPGRRDSSIRRLRETGEGGAVRSVLFVCYGNVCRSPYAEWAFVDRIEELDLEVDSGGFIGPGRAPPDRAIEAARELGVEHESHVSKVVTPGMLESADAIFVFDSKNLRMLRRMEAGRSSPVFLLGDFDPAWEGKRVIVDPWGEPVEEFRRTFARIDRCLDTVRRTLLEARGDAADQSSSVSGRGS